MFVKPPSSRFAPKPLHHDLLRFFISSRLRTQLGSEVERSVPLVLSEYPIPTV